MAKLAAFAHNYSRNTAPVTIFTIVWVVSKPRPIMPPQFFSKYIYESMCLPKPNPGGGCSWLSGLLACWPRGCITIIYGYIDLWEAPRGSLTERGDSFPRLGTSALGGGFKHGFICAWSWCSLKPTAGRLAVGAGRLYGDRSSCSGCS